MVIIFKCFDYLYIFRISIGYARFWWKGIQKNASSEYNRLRTCIIFCIDVSIRFWIFSNWNLENQLRYIDCRNAYGLQWNVLSYHKNNVCHELQLKFLQQKLYIQVTLGTSENWPYMRNDFWIEFNNT